MRKIFVVLAAFIFTLQSFAQDADGYYVKKTGDTIRGKIQVPVNKKFKLGASSQSNLDPLKEETLTESGKIEYPKLTFDFKFSEDGQKFTKIDREKVKGFGFTYEGRQYDFITWDVRSHKQLYLMPAMAAVEPNGVYLILKSVDAALPIYSLFQDVEMERKGWDNRNPTNPVYRRDYDGYASQRDIVIGHPTKGLLYITREHPLRLKFTETLQYLELEEEFIKTVTKKEDMLGVILRYNKWKSGRPS